MILKRGNHSSQSYIQAGMVSFLLGIFASQVADARLIGAYLTSWIPNEALVSFIQGFADGFSLPMLVASIILSLRGLAMQRSQ